MAAADRDRSSHLVQFYESEAFLHRAITDFFAQGAAGDDELVMISRRGTFEAVAAPFAPRRIRFFDADETLSRIVSGATIAPTRCEQFFENMQSEVGADGDQRSIRIYGDMVDLLCSRGLHAVAIDLEGRWNDTFAGHAQVSVLCGYAIEHFDADRAPTNLLQVCRQHTHVLPAEVFTDVADEGQFERAVLLQHRARTSKVYVVDDDASVRRSLRRLLTARRFQVETFESAEEFLTCVDVSPNGCLLLDLQLLGMSGPELQSRLGDESRPLAVIAMSGSHNPWLEVEALRLGASAFLPKPFEIHALLEAIARASTSVRQ